MSQSSNTTEKHPRLEPAEDFYRLRRDGIGFIEQMASQLWTDYNTHDPGITILDALSYAITDLAYRIGWDIKDILAPEYPSSDALHPYPNQPFFTAREILTVNPVTIDDFRRLLIDLSMVRNAWIFCREECECALSYYALSEKQELRLSFQKLVDTNINATTVTPKGLYEVRLELEADPELGDLNDRKIEYREVFHDNEGAHEIIMELRFPDINLNDEELYSVELRRMGRTKNVDDNLFSLTGSSDANKEEQQFAYIRKNWRAVFYLDFAIKRDSIPSLPISNASLRIFINSAPAFGRWLTSIGGADGLKKKFQQKYSVYFIQQYCKKVNAVKNAVMNAKAALWSHRNLDEDYCSVSVVAIEDVALCADIEVKPDADIELIQAKIWFEIERYFNPPIRFYTVNELMEAGELVEEVFNGPKLECGFIRSEDLEKADLKSELRTSDIINSLMEIEGVVSVSQVLLTKYDAEGNVVRGCADPDNNGTFDQNKTSASWLLRISEQQQPRLYRNASRFLFFKNALPFLPRMDEALDALNQLCGESERPKNNNADNDLNIPTGTFRTPEEYFPVQYSLPLFYGVGPEGLPANASEERRAQAKQLKAYLCVFEQILGNALSQLAHTPDLFSLDTAIGRTGFVKEFSERLICGFDEIRNDKYTVEFVENMAESSNEFLLRRNRLLDHLLARFGEQFSEYALLLGRVDGKKVAQKRLLDDKISFIKAYPQISYDRAKAFDYSRPAPFDYASQVSEQHANEPGIKKRINLLLGYPNLNFFFTDIHPAYGPGYTATFELRDRNKKIWLQGKITVQALSPTEVAIQAVRDLLVRMTQSQGYTIVHKQKKNLFQLTLKDKTGKKQLAVHPPLFNIKADEQKLQTELQTWSANERMIVVEHLLLRPKFPGDALYPVCSEGGGNSAISGHEDPYSFRLTFVMPGWTPLYSENLEMRRFAERTIRNETPSHLIGKICWAGNDDFNDSQCNDVVGAVAGLLFEKCLESSGFIADDGDLCACAKAIYNSFSEVFKAWYKDKTLDIIHSDTLDQKLESIFTTIDSGTINCSFMFDNSLCWTEVQQIMRKHFRQVVLSGWQFDRFENAWFKWLEANAEIDWSEERLHEKVVALLRTKQTTDVNLCASKILGQYGQAFYEWMNEYVKSGKLPDEKFNPEPTPDFSCLDKGIDGELSKEITDFLNERYNNYKEVSYRLWLVVNQLSSLRNIYPVATLHDCDDGSDQNPVRLDNTALGYLPLD